MFSGCVTRLFVLGSGRRPLAVHPKFEISSKNAQARPAAIKASHLARLVRASGTYKKDPVLRGCVRISPNDLQEAAFRKSGLSDFLTRAAFEEHSEFQTRTTPECWASRNLCATPIIELYHVARILA